MPQVPNKVAERLAAGIKRFQPILASAKTRDVGESDTVIIVTINILKSHRSVLFAGRGVTLPSRLMVRLNIYLR